MADFKFLDKARTTATEIIDDSRSYLSRVYKNAGNYFTTASPFSLLLRVFFPGLSESQGVERMNWRTDELWRMGGGLRVV